MATTKKFLQAAAGVGGGEQGPDEFFNQTTLLLHGDGTQGGQNNTFLDESPNAFQITRNGNATQGSFSPFGDRWSVDFTNNNNDMSVSTSAGAGLGNVFTIEGWVYPATLDTSYGLGTLLDANTLAGSNSTEWWAIHLDGANINFGHNNAGVFTTTGNDFTANEWQHFAIVADGSNLNFYRNGVNIGSTSFSATITGNRPLYVARQPNSNGFLRYFKGYMADVRLVSGSAVYTSAFTPPTEPLTAISGTTVLTCQSNRFVDNSSNAYSITIAGTPSVTKFSPYAPSGAYIPAPPDINAVAFDGSGDYLTVPDSTAFDLPADFTIEFWAYPEANGLDPRFFSLGDASSAGIAAIINANAGNKLQVGGQTGTASIQDYAWSHIAIVRQGTSTNNIKAYVNGVLDIQYTDTTSFTGVSGSGVKIGAVLSSGTTFATFKTKMAGFRIVKGTAVYTSAFTPPTEPLTAVSGTSLLTCQDGFVDNSSNGFTITTSGNPQLTEFGPFGAGDGYWSNGFDGNGDYLTFPNDADFAFGTGAFTIEFWINAPLNNDKFILGGRNAVGTMHITTGGSGSTAGVLRYVGSSTIVSSNVITDSDWHHCVIVRDGSNNITLYVDGSSVGTGTDTTNYTTTSGTWVIAENDLGSGNYLTGSISNFRIVKGTALYTSSFTPSTTPLTAVTGTSLLTCQSNRFVDNSSNAFAITVNGDPEVLAANPFDDNIPEEVGSGYFDGTTAYLEAGLNSAFDFGTGDFTIETWIYPIETSDNRPLVSCHQAGIADGWYFHYDHSSGVPKLENFPGAEGVASSTSLKRYSWNHLVLTRINGTFKIYIDGVETGSNTVSFTMDQDSRPLRIGAVGGSTSYLGGYLSNFRIVKGTALYTAAFTPPTQPLTPVPNTSLLLNFDNAEIFDSTGMNDLETVGNAQIDTSVVKYGTGSLKFDGSDFLRSTNGVFQLGSGDFTIEHWIYLPDAATLQGIFRIWDGSNQANYSTDLYIVSGQFSWDVKSGATGKAVTANTSIASNTWAHIALTRYQNELAMYIDGVKQTDTEDATGFDLVYTNFELGTHYGTLGETTYAFTGYIDDFRITKGVARYTANFTPPAQAFPDQ